MRKRITEGDYLVWIVKAEPSSDQLNVTFRLTGGNHDSLGKSVLMSFPLRRGAPTLREMIEACGKKVPSASVKLNLDRLIGLECAGTVLDDGHGRMVISAFFPVVHPYRNLNRTLREISGMVVSTGEMPKYVM
jgi:hypothetical protein